MGGKIRKRAGKWYVFIDYHGQRKEQVRRQLEAKLALGDLGVFDADARMPTFGVYADKWLKEYARVECKTSTAEGYEGVIEQYLGPRFGNRPLDQIKRDDIKAMINALIEKDLSRNTVRNALCVIRGMFNQAIESGIVEVNPEARLAAVSLLRSNGETFSSEKTSTTRIASLSCSTTMCGESIRPPRARKAVAWTSPES
jgi:hypothetical protein